MKGFLKRNAKTFWLFVLGPVTGSIFAYWYFQLRPAELGAMTPPDIGIGLSISLAITFLSSLLGFQINLSENSHEIKQEIREAENRFLDRQKKLLENRAKIIEISGDEINRMIMEKARNANVVRNTYVNLAEKMAKVSNSETDSVKIYNEFLSKEDRHWIDVTTAQDMSLGRYKVINPEGVGNGSRHEICIVNTQTDILNFILIDKNNRPSDLFFGWMSEDGEYFRVFWTNNKNIMDTFAIYFSNLRNVALEHFEIDYHDDVRYKAQSDMLIGRWVCVPQLERMTTSEIFRTYSILEITIERGVWVVRSDIYNKANRRKIRVIESEMAMSHGESLFFEGVSRSVGGTRKNITFGQFKIAPDYEDIIIGTYVAEDASTISRLFGCRVTGQSGDEKLLSIDAAIHKIITKRDLMRADDWRKDSP